MRFLGEILLEPSRKYDRGGIIFSSGMAIFSRSNRRYNGTTRDAGGKE
jgi:hypothetical protein